VEQENLGPKSEVSECEDLIQWLDEADQILQIIEKPVYDHEEEFLVSFLIILASLFDCMR